jgi:hypothetical protein
MEVPTEPIGSIPRPRETAFAKIRARVRGTAMAARELGAGS